MKFDPDRDEFVTVVVRAQAGTAKFLADAVEQTGNDMWLVDPHHPAAGFPVEVVRVGSLPDPDEVVVQPRDKCPSAGSHPA